MIKAGWLRKPEDPLPPHTQSYTELAQELTILRSIQFETLALETQLSPGHLGFGQGLCQFGNIFRGHAGDKGGLP